jgi:hypothetical protein
VHQFVTALLTDAQIFGISMSALAKQGLEFIHSPSQNRSDQPALALSNDAGRSQAEGDDAAVGGEHVAVAGQRPQREEAPPIKLRGHPLQKTAGRKLRWPLYSRSQ